MKRFSMWQTLICLFVGLLVASCAMDQRFVIPGTSVGQTPDPTSGEDGKSAYELWLAELQAGNVVNYCTKDPWDPELDSLWDFFDWLRGCNGTDGRDGADGAPGRDGDTPYIGPDGDWWIGDEDTDVPAHGRDGAPGGNGTPGLSAYDLWVIEVMYGRVVDCDGNKVTDTSETAYFTWLKGCKGDDGEDGKPGAPGKPGGIIPIEIGKYNVIPEYTQREYSEFVSTSDGSVTFTVYDKEGNTLEGAVITAMPGVNPEVFANSSVKSGPGGKFSLSKDQLPVNKSEVLRSGSSSVKVGNAEPEASAPNTYVPEKIGIRLRMRNATPSLGGSQEVRVSVIVERRTAVGTPWTVVPSYLSGVNTGFTGYLLTDDPAKMTANGITARNISGTDLILTAARPRVRSGNVPDYWENETLNNVWDGTTRYFTWKLDNYYGEPAQLLAYRQDGDYEDKVYAYIEKTPIQRVPIIKNVKMGQPEEVFGVQATSPTSGSIDMSDVQYKYIYRPDDPDTFSGEDKGNGVWFTAEPMNEADADALRIFIVGFSHKRTEGGDEEIINTGTDEAQWLGLKSDWALTGTVYDGSLAYVSVSKANYFVGVALHDKFTFGKVSFAEEKIGPSPSLSGKYPASSIEPIDIEFDAE